ncbi:hypothetical protein C8Q70DRAFT_740536 [Cubamyces menziesii]|nr:hypothetical protein C8Q70DRAFT_740536 [Cubamyces menziesii]
MMRHVTHVTSAQSSRCLWAYPRESWEREIGGKTVGLRDRVGPTRTDRAGGGGAGHMITSPGDVGAQRRIVGTRGSHCATPISPLAPRSPPNRGACRARLTQYSTGVVPSSGWQRRHPARPLHARATHFQTALSNCARLGRSAAAPAGFWAPTTAAQPEAVRDLTPAYRCASSGADVHTTKALVRYSPPGKSNAPFGPPDSPLQNSRGSASPTRRTNACGMGGEPQSVLAIPGRVPEPCGALAQP